MTVVRHDYKGIEKKRIELLGPIQRFDRFSRAGRICKDRYPVESICCDQHCAATKQMMILEHT